MSKTSLRLFFHILGDFTAAFISWLALFVYRKNVIEAVKHGYQIPINQDIKLYLGLVFIPLFWIFIYSLTGHYQYILRR